MFNKSFDPFFSGGSWQTPEQRLKRLFPPPMKKTNTEIPVLGKFFDSFIDNVFKDMVKPVEGSIVHCSLAHVFEHTGIYIGNETIVHLEGEGLIEIVTPRQFINRLDSKNPAMSIYVSCIDTTPVGSREIANRAKAYIGDFVKYDVLTNNCHKFTSSCITGNPNNIDTTFTELEYTIKKHLGANEWRVWDLAYE